MTADEPGGAVQTDTDARSDTLVLDEQERGPARYTEEEQTRFEKLVVLIYRWRVGLGVLALCFALLVVMTNSLRDGSEETDRATNTETLAGPDISLDGADPEDSDSRLAAGDQVDSDSNDSTGIRSGVQTDVPVNDRTTVAQDDSLLASGTKSGAPGPETTSPRPTSGRVVTSGTASNRNTTQAEDRADAGFSRGTTTPRSTTERQATTALERSTTATTVRATTRSTVRRTTVRTTPTTVRTTPTTVRTTPTTVRTTPTTVRTTPTTVRTTPTTRRVTTVRTTQRVTTTTARPTTIRTTTTVTTPSTLGISGYSFISLTGNRIRAVQNGGTYSISELGNFSIEISATADAGSVEAVHNNNTPHAENQAPFGVFWNSVSGDSWEPWNPGPGRHTITARAYSQDFLAGQSGPPLTITFTLTN